ncbi:MAG: AI-2E family transporter [Deltaproteobacteria bacterium]|nr:AI-2E family transporter [Deltaproteobacteria bacterium]
MEQKSAPKVFFVILMGSVVLLFTLFWNYISSIILALLITSVSYPMYQRVRRLFRHREHSAALFTTILVLVVLVIPVSWFVGTLSQEAFQFYDRTRNVVSLKKLQDTLNADSPWVRRIKKWGDRAGFIITPESVEKLASSVGKSVGLFLYKQLSTAASNLFNFLIHFFLMILTIYYLYRDGARLKEYLIQLLPVPKEQLEKLAWKFNEMGRAIVIGNGLSGIIQGILGGFGFFLFGLESSFLWGTVIAFMAFLPIIGASVIFVPTAVLLAMEGETARALGFLSYNVFYSSLVEYVVKPRMIGKGMQMNALLVFVGIIGGMKIFGILGIIYGPLIITVFLTLAEIYRLEYKGQTL